MARMPDEAVKRALNEVNGLASQEGLRPELLDRIRDIYGDPDPDRRLARAQALLAELGEQVEANGRQLEREQDEFGLGRDQSRRFLEEDALSDQARSELKGELDRLVQDAASDAHRVARESATRRTTAARAPRANRLRI